jgi:hypothetical protein
MSHFEVYLDSERRLVRVVASGELFQKDGEKIISIAREKAAENGFDILYDIRAATTTVAFASWYKLPRELEVFKNPRARQAKTAVIVSRTDKALKDYKFYEIVTENVGIKLRVFFEENEALAWLAD